MTARAALADLSTMTDWSPVVVVLASFVSVWLVRRSRRISAAAARDIAACAEAGARIAARWLSIRRQFDQGPPNDVRWAAVPVGALVWRPKADQPDDVSPVAVSSAPVCPVCRIQRVLQVDAVCGVCLHELDEAIATLSRWSA